VVQELQYRVANFGCKLIIYNMNKRVHLVTFEVYFQSQIMGTIIIASYTPEVQLLKALKILIILYYYASKENGI